MRLITRELKKIRSQKGAITADNVLEAARDENHPLHRFFDWDDASAAEKFRRQQATQMIARVVVNIDVQGAPRTVRAFIGVDRDAERQYLPAVEVLSDKESRLRILAEMKSDLEAMRRRYETYDFCAKALKEVGRALSVLEEAMPKKGAKAVGAERERRRAAG